MNNEIPPGNNINEFSATEKVFLKEQKLRQLLALYTEGMTIGESNIDESNIKQKIVSFRTKYPDIRIFQTQGDPMKLFRYTDGATIEEFKSIMFPRMSSEDQWANTGESLPLQDVSGEEFNHPLDLKESEISQAPPTPDFGASGSDAKNVETIKNYAEILKEKGSHIVENKRFRSIIAQYVLKNFDARDTVTQENIVDILDAFFMVYPNLETFEKKGDIGLFLAQISKPEEYRQAIADFEDLLYGEHKER